MHYVDPLGLFTCETCEAISGFISGQVDRLPFNPHKAISAVINSANAGRLVATGLIKMGVGVAADGTVVLTPVGTASMAWGAWNLKSASKAWERAQQQMSEAMNESGKDRCLKNYFGVLPYGTEFDDPDEPGPWEFAKIKAKNALHSPLEFLEEIGTWLP